MSDERRDCKGPFITWVENGGEGFVATSTDTLAQAVAVESYGSQKVVTRLVEWEPVEVPAPPSG